MNALILPGNSPRHAKWAESLSKYLASYLDIAAAQHYKHWQSSEEFADVDYEITAAKQTADNLGAFVVVGKSIGTVVALKGVAIGALHPEKIILLGVPINGVADSDILVQWLRQTSVPVVIAQNESDPFGPFEDVKKAFTRASADITFIKLAGDTHDYLDFDAIAKLI